MGLCASQLTDEQRREKERSKEIDLMAQTDFDSEKQKIKLLLLGAGESGKSTIFKQMKILYGVEYTEEEKIDLRPVIYQNVLFGIKTVVENMPKQGEKPSGDAVKLCAEILDVPDDETINQELGNKVATIWADAGVQATFEKRANFQVQDALKYYADDIERLAQDTYVPSADDILRARVRTSGIVEEKYNIDSVPFCMYDVGGQRNERKKWIHCFDDVTAVIFVAAISEYDQVLYEDNTMNRIDEALTLFQEICNSTWFANTSMILFLNKKDLFYEKVVKVPFRVDPDGEDGKGRNVDYDGPDPMNIPEGVTKESVLEGLENYMKEKFEGQNSHPDTKEVYTHVTCATDTRNIKHVFDSTKDIILKTNLKTSGFMD